MDVIVTVHTEFGVVLNRKVLALKEPGVIGVYKGLKNILRVANKYNVRLTLAVMPEVASHVPKDVLKSRLVGIGLHVHPGWVKFRKQGIEFYVGDSVLKELVSTSINASVLKDYSYKEQSELIKAGRDYIEDKLGERPKVFVAGRWSINDHTVRALINCGFTHDCTPPAHQSAAHFDWSKLPRIAMPYLPSESNYQLEGNLPLLICPISQYYPLGNVNPEASIYVGTKWLKACFLEYYGQGLPFFHIILHSPAATDPYLLTSFDELVSFISRHENVSFRHATEVKYYGKYRTKTNLFPYLFYGLNPLAVRSLLISWLKRKHKKKPAGCAAPRT